MISHVAEDNFPRRGSFFGRISLRHSDPNVSDVSEPAPISDSNVSEPDVPAQLAAPLRSMPRRRSLTFSQSNDPDVSARAPAPARSKPRPRNPFRRSTDFDPGVSARAPEPDAPAQLTPSRWKPRRAMALRRRSDGDPDVSAHAPAPVRSKPRPRISFRLSDPGGSNPVLLPRHPHRRHSTSAAEISEHTTSDPVAVFLSVQEAEERKNAFLGSLPESLAAAYDSRDCVAPFRREEVG